MSPLSDISKYFLPLYWLSFTFLIQSLIELNKYWCIVLLHINLCSEAAVQVRFFFSFGPQVPNGSFSASEIFLVSSVEMFLLHSMGTIHGRYRASLVKSAYIEQLQS